MTVNQFIQGVYASLTQQGSTLLINSDNLLTFVNYAMCDVLTYEGRVWTFQHVTGNSETTPGTTTFHTITIPNSDTETIKRILSIKTSRGTSTLDDSIRFKMKQDGIINSDREVYLRPNDTSFKVYDVIGNPITYEYSYVRGFKFLTGLTDDVPLPDEFLPALHSLTLSYCSIPYGQYSDGKEVNFYSKGMNQLGNLAKSDGMQISSIVTNIQ